MPCTDERCRRRTHGLATCSSPTPRRRCDRGDCNAVVAQEHQAERSCADCSSRSRRQADARIQDERHRAQSTDRQSETTIGGNDEETNRRARARRSPPSRRARRSPIPSRPITLIVPFPPGGSTDTVARIMAERMRPILGQPIVIENVGGAGGSIAVGRVARAPPTATPSTSASGTPMSAASSTSSTTTWRRTSSRSG